jgi:hypothetical protein
VTSSTEQLLEKLRAGTPNGIAATYLGSVRPNDLDGNRWHLLASDGHKVVEIVAGLSETERIVANLAELDSSQLESAVERRARNFPREHGLAELQLAGLQLRADDF